MLTTRTLRQRGFSLIELMITLAIAAILLIMAAPSYGIWVADQQIHTAAESIMSGLRSAQSQAIKRNGPVRFIINPATGTGGWFVRDESGVDVNQAVFAQGSPMVQFTVNGGFTEVTFDGLGRVVNDVAPPGPCLTLCQVNIRHSVLPTAATRELTVLVGAGRTGVKICDPKWTVIDPNDPKACPP